MPGFIAHIGKIKYNFGHETRPKLIVDYLQGKDYQVERRVVNKFMNDRVFIDNNDFLIVVEGVILNKQMLITKYQSKNWLNCVVDMYFQTGDTFFNEFRGSFSGLLYDKKLEKWLVFTDHIGDKQVVYCKTNDGFLLGSEVGFLVDICKLNNQKLTLDKASAYMAISIGFTIEDNTLISEIHKVIPGHYLIITKEGLKNIQYHRFSNKPKETMTLGDAIEGIDKLFRHAVQLEFEKDKEYGYKHISCLSGGLDSRMTVWVGHELGYTDQLNVTFSQSNYIDFKVAQQIATDLGHDFLFQALDGGNFIMDIDAVTRVNYGSAYFHGTAHEYSLARKINWNEYGVMHTGQVGDVIVGSFQRRMSYGDKPNICDGAKSTTMIDRLQGYKFKYNYEDVEIYKLYNRGFGGTAQGILGEQEFTEVLSPFCDVDFLEFCYSIPLIWRFNHKIYIDWILNKYPQAARYIWEKTGRCIKPIDNTPKELNVHHWTVLGHTIPSIKNPDFKPYLYRKFNKLLNFKDSCNVKPDTTLMLLNKNSMTPFDYWYNTNHRLKHFMDNYWMENQKLIDDSILLKDLKCLYEDTTVVLDKLLVLSYVAAVKLIKSNV